MPFTTVPTFVRKTGFAEDEAAGKGGRSTVDTAGLNTEFINVKNVLDALTGNLNVIQRSDGELANEIVKTTALHPDILTFIAAALPPITFADAILSALDTGAVNAYEVTIAPVPEAYYTFMTVWVKISITNTNVSTIDVNGLGPKSIKKGVTTVLDAGDLPAGGMVVLMYDGTNFQLLNPAIDILAHTGNTSNPHAVTKAQVGLSNVSDLLQLVAANNLSDLASAATARSNLGVQTTIDVVADAWKVLAKTLNYTVVAADDWKLVEMDATAGVRTVTLPPVATVGDGFVIGVKKVDASANAVTVDADGSEKIDGVNTNLLTVETDSILLVCDGDEWHVLAEKKSGSATDEKIKISGDDTLAGDLETKLLPGSGIVLSTQNPGGNETRTITAVLTNLIKTADLQNDSVTVDKIGTGAVDQTAIGAAAVGQGELKTTTGEVTDTNTTFIDKTLPGGEYGLYPRVKMSGGGTFMEAQIADSISGASYVTHIAIRVNTSGTAHVQQRYVQASPPYELGGILIPTFIFALIENGTGKISAMYQAADPPWANNGPTDIKAQRIDLVSGKRFRTVRTRKPLANFNDPDFWTDTEVEVTPEFKNSDMGLIPHPFIGNDLTGKTIVMIDPRMKLVERLHEMIEVGESPLTLFHDDDIRIGNTDIPALVRPSGVIVVNATLR